MSIGQDSIGRPINNTGELIMPERKINAPILDTAMRELQDLYESAYAAQEDAKQALRLAQEHHDDCVLQRNRIEQALNELRGMNDTIKAENGPVRGGSVPYTVH